MLLKILLIILDFIVLLGVYIFIQKRLKILNNRHIKHIWNDCIKRDYKFLVNVIAMSMIVLFVFSFLVIVTML